MVPEASKKKCENKNLSYLYVIETFGKYTGWEGSDFTLNH